MMSVRIWEGEKKSFGEISDIEILNGQIKTIRPSIIKPKEETRYLLPGFCDASVTLSANAMGGESAKESLPYLLQSFLASGFSHVVSVSDPDLQKVKEEIHKGRLFGPNLLPAQKPIVLTSHFSNESKPTKQYQMANDGETHFLPLAMAEGRSKILPIFLKRTREEAFSQSELYQIKIDALKNGYEPIIYTFADPQSWEDALDAGYQVLFHALPSGANLEEVQKRNYRFAPMLALSYFQSLRETPVILKEKITTYSKFNPVFKEKFLESFTIGLGEGEDQTKAKKAKITYESFSENFKEFPRERLVFASGTGHYGIFPGIGAVVEADIWLNLWKQKMAMKDEAKNVEEPSFFERWNLWFRGEKFLQIPKTDPTSLPKDQIQLVEILTKTTCSFIKADHGGLIKVGGPAHFSVHKGNPLNSYLGIFAIESMVLGGKLVYTPKPEKVGKKP